MKNLVLCAMMCVVVGCADWDQRPLGDDQQADGSVVQTDAGVDAPPPVCASGQLNRDPVVQILSPARNTTFVRPGASLVTVVVEAYDPDAPDLKQVQVVFRMDGQQEKWFASSVRTGNRYQFDVQTAGVMVDGTWQIEAIAEGYNQCGNDSDGQDITGMPVEQRVPVILTTPQPSNNAPTCAITSPANGATFTVSSGGTVSVPFTGTSTDSDGNVVKVEFYKNGSVLENDWQAPYALQNSMNLGVGTYSLKMKCYDDDGATSEQTVTVTVNQSNQCTGTIGNLTSSTQFAVVGTPIDLDATFPCPSGAISRVEFKKNNNLLLCTDTAAPYHCDWGNAPVGMYTVIAVAYAPGGAQLMETNQLTITVFQSSGDVECHGLGLYFSNTQVNNIHHCTKWGKPLHPGDPTPSADITKATFLDGGIGACALTCYDNTGNTVLPMAVTGVWLYQGTSDVTRWYTTGCARLPWHPAAEPDQAGGAWDKLCDRPVTTLSGPPNTNQ